MTQEQIVDTKMLDLLEKKHAGSKHMILENSDKSKRRLSMLSILDDDRRLFEKYKEIVSKESYCSEYAEDSVYVLREYVKVADVEVEKYGEIMTPIFLVEDMLNTLPQEIWKNPNLKWLDPCNGVGTFISVVVKNLMKGLEQIIKDPCERYKHIIEKMIYVCEIQEKNMFLFQCIFDRDDDKDLNVFCGSYLDSNFQKHMKEVWNIDKFDIIIGNPPYNIETKGGNGSRVLWDKFVIKSHEYLQKNGYLVFVHPNKWRAPEHPILSLFKTMNLKYLEIHSKKDGKKTFDAITRYDFYCIQKSDYNGITKIKDELGNFLDIDIREWHFIPNYNFDLIKKITTENSENTLNVFYSRTMYGNDKKWMSKLNNEEYHLPCVYSLYKDGSKAIRYSSVNKGHFGIPKIIMSCGEVPYAFSDMDGVYGLMNNCFGIETNSQDDTNLICSVINGSSFSEVISSTKWSNFQIDHKMFKFFKKDFWKEFI